MSLPIENFRLPDGRWDMIGYRRSLKHSPCGRGGPGVEHCPNCGKFATLIAGDQSVRHTLERPSREPTSRELNGPWHRTSCKKCGTWEIRLRWTDEGWQTESKEKVDVAH